MAVINGNHNIIKGELTLHLFIYLLFIYLFIYPRYIAHTRRLRYELFKVTINVV